MFLTRQLTPLKCYFAQKDLLSCDDVFITFHAIIKAFIYFSRFPFHHHHHHHHPFTARQMSDLINFVEQFNSNFHFFFFFELINQVKSDLIHITMANDTPCGTSSTSKITQKLTFVNMLSVSQIEIKMNTKEKLLIQLHHHIAM